jgi:hypothetical protein
MEEYKSTTETKKNHFGDLKGHVGDYVKTYIDLTKAKIAGGASTAVSGIAIGFVAFILFFFFLFFACFGLGWWLGGLLNSMTAGFFIVAGLFLLLIVLIIALSKKVIIPKIRNTIISKIYE